MSAAKIALSVVLYITILGISYDDFGTNVRLELLNGLRMAGTNVTCQKTPQNEVELSQTTEWTLINNHKGMCELCINY